MTTSFFDWCCKYFAQPMRHTSEDTESTAFYEQQYRCMQAARIQSDASAELRKTRKSSEFSVTRFIF